MTTCPTCSCTEPCDTRQIAERYMAHHTDGTVIATAEVLGLNLQQLWWSFFKHHYPRIQQQSDDPHTQAYVVVKSFEDWCMDQLAEAWDPEAAAFQGEGGH